MPDPTIVPRRAARARRRTAQHHLVGTRVRAHLRGDRVRRVRPSRRTCPRPLRQARRDHGAALDGLGRRRSRHRPRGDGAGQGRLAAARGLGHLRRRGGPRVRPRRRPGGRRPAGCAGGGRRPGRRGDPPGAGEIETACECDAWVQPCEHALALLYQLAWQLDADPYVLTLLRGHPREWILDEIESRLVADRGPAERDDAMHRAALLLSLAEHAPAGHGLADSSVAAYDEAVAQLLDPEDSTPFRPTRPRPAGSRR